MMEPCCAVCGETKISNLFMFNYGMCLCHRCMGIAAQSFIHDNAERRLKEAEAKRKAVDVEGLSKAEYESMRELKDKLRKEIEASIEAKVRAESEAKRKASRITEAEEAAQIRMADLSIENNRLRTKLKDLEKEHSDFLDGCFWLSWSLLGAGVVAGMLLSYFLIK